MNCGIALVADADESFREWAVAALERDGLAVVEAADGLVALELAEAATPAIAIVDLALPGASGYAVCQRLRERLGESFPIVLVSAERTETADRVAGLMLGADDYLAKPVDGDELLARVRRLLARTTTRASNQGSKLSELLTPRELEVLRLLAGGRSGSDIALALTISPKTVASHIQSILGKLGVHSRAQAVARAFEVGVVAPNADFELAWVQVEAASHEPVLS